MLDSATNSARQCLCGCHQQRHGLEAFAERSRQYRQVSHVFVDHEVAQLPALDPRRSRIQPTQTLSTGQIVDSGAYGFGQPCQYSGQELVAHRVLQATEPDHKRIYAFRQIYVNLRESARWAVMG